VTIGEATAVNTVLRWAMAAAAGRPARTPAGMIITDDMATAAARTLAGRAYKTLAAGLTAGDITLEAGE